jgi:hypothetical protein
MGGGLVESYPLFIGNRAKYVVDKCGDEVVDAVWTIVWQLLVKREVGWSELVSLPVKLSSPTKSLSWSFSRFCVADEK